MFELIKIKISDENISEWPEYLKLAVSNKDDYHLEISSLHKLCDLCDYLVFRNNRLFFVSSELGEMSFQLEDLYAYHRKQNYALSKEPLARALAIKGANKEGEKKVVWDTTCGSAKDSLLIHSFGASVYAFERNPVIYLLLRDALRIFPMGFELFYGDASKLSLEHLPRPDVIYYDPMYPTKKKSALPRKEMRIFKELVGEDLDSKDFLDWAMTVAIDRVVVKRPLEAAPLNTHVAASYSGKSTRYDMYKIF